MDITLDRIIQELKAQNKKQQDLTDCLGINYSSFGNWKAGRNSSYKKYIHAIADYLDVSVEYLRGETDIKKDSPSSIENELSEYKDVIELFKAATPELRAAALAVLKSAPPEE